MIHIERQMQIMKVLQERQCVTVEYLSKKLYISGATVRRDLKRMEEQGLLKRVRGGAVLDGGTHADDPVLLRVNKNKEEKAVIAGLALPFLKKASTIFMDSSSTVTELARLCGETGEKSIISNGVDTLNLLNDYGNISVYSTGGMIRNHSSLVGSIAQSSISSRYADVLFFSCCGVSAERGVTEATEQNAAVKKAMAANSRLRILLADHDKINKVYFCRSCGLETVDILITDKTPPADFSDKADCRIIFPEQ